jgi:hypothetical protein
MPKQDPFAPSQVKMAMYNKLCFSGVLLLSQAIVASGDILPSPTSLSFNTPTGYSTQVYDASAAATTASSAYSNQELGRLWDRIGPIAVGVITNTVSIASEPKASERPGRFHVQVGKILVERRVHN